MKNDETGCDCGQCQIATIFMRILGHLDVNRALEERKELEAIRQHPTLCSLDDMDFAMLCARTSAMCAEKVISDHPEKVGEIARFEAELVNRIMTERVQALAH